MGQGAGAPSASAARAVHSHRNRGPGMMKSLVLQDGARDDQLRNPGFAWAA